MGYYSLLHLNAEAWGARDFYRISGVARRADKS